MLIELKMWIIPVAAIIPMILGFIWYNPKVMGNVWMKETGLNDDKIKGANMGIIFGLSYVFACLIGFFMLTVVVHQMGLNSLVMDKDEATREAAKALLILAQENYRTFGHGFSHGVLTTLFFVLPVMATNALFERKSWKYIWINTGYWMITLALMGGVICQFA